MFVEIPRTRYAKTIDGVNIAYQVRGHGPVDLIRATGFTGNFEVKDPQRCLGTTREQAARKALSIRRSLGRPTLRESTFTWCRRTTTSISSSRYALG